MFDELRSTIQRLDETNNDETTNLYELRSQFGLQRKSTKFDITSQPKINSSWDDGELEAMRTRIEEKPKKHKSVKRRGITDKSYYQNSVITSSQTDSK